MMHKLALVTLVCFTVLATSFAQSDCNDLTCDACPTYRDENGPVEVEQTAECVVNNGKAELNCSCADPPEGALPAARDAPADNGDTTGTTAGGGADFNDLPPDGGSGASIPTQSFGTPSSAATRSSTSLLFLAAAIAVAAATA